MARKIDETGNKYGRLLVLREDPIRKNRRVNWICQCDCGKEVSIDGTHLRSGQTQSCGCLKTEKFVERNKKRLTNKPSDKRINEIGNRYGRLVVLADAGAKDGRASWLCQCDCGNQIVVKGKYLRNGDTKSCGCLHSSGQEKISLLLRKNNIPFIQEKTFDTCRLPDTNNLARFDFYVDNRYLIEFDGIQHFKQTGWRTQQEFERDKARDLFKDQWTKKYNIPLIRIKYNELEDLKLSDLIPETSRFLCKR